MAGRRRAKLRSSMEDRIVPPLLKQGAEYEPIRLVYAAKPRAYKPDVVLPNGVVIEIKGWFRSADRAKMALVKQQYPELDLRMVLASPYQRLNKTSKTTQASWCAQHGIPFADTHVPLSWLTKPKNEASLAIIQAAPRVRKMK